MKKNTVVQPVYSQVALDLAAKIAAGEYAEGMRLSGRSTLASHYGVSPETIRRAVYLLKDMDVLEITKGSGIVIRSAENAARYAKQRGSSETLESIRQDIFSTLLQQQENAAHLADRVHHLMDLCDRFKSADPLTHFALEIEEGMQHIGRTSADLMFWHNTGATITAIKRGGKLLLSPGPYAEFEKGDILYFVGDESAYTRVVQLFRPEKDADPHERSLPCNV